MVVSFLLLYFAIIKDSFAANVDMKHSDLMILLANISVTTPTADCSPFSQDNLI